MRVYKDAGKIISVSDTDRYLQGEDIVEPLSGKVVNINDVSCQSCQAKIEAETKRRCWEDICELDVLIQDEKDGRIAFELLDETETGELLKQKWEIK